MWSTLTALRNWHASTSAAKIHVLVFAASMQIAGLEIIFRSAFATKGIEVIPSTDATELQRNHQDPKLLTLAILLLVASMQFAMRGLEQLPANVCLDCRETLMLNASLSAQSTKNVPQAWHVSHKSAKTLVLEYVALLPHVP